MSPANFLLPTCHSSTLFKPRLLMIAGKPLLLSPETPSCSKFNQQMHFCSLLRSQRNSIFPWGEQDALLQSCFCSALLHIACPTVLGEHIHPVSPQPPQPQDTATLTKASISPLIWKQHYKSRYLILPYHISAARPTVRKGPQGRRTTNHGKGVTLSCPEETHLCIIVSAL